MAARQCLRTCSYSPKLTQYSQHYRTYSNVLDIRTVNAEYLVAMKLMSGRRYKKDMSDIVGIINEQEKIGKPLDFPCIDKAVNHLYGGWDGISEHSISAEDGVGERESG